MSKPDTVRYSRFLPTPTAFEAPVRRGGGRPNIAPNIATTFDTEKLEWRGYPMVRKTEDMFYVYSFRQNR